MGSELNSSVKWGRGGLGVSGGTRGKNWHFSLKVILGQGKRGNRIVIGGGREFRLKQFNIYKLCKLND